VMNAVIGANAASPNDWLLVTMAPEATTLAIGRGSDLGLPSADGMLVVPPDLTPWPAGPYAMSILVRLASGATILVDTSSDLRAQALRFKLSRIDAVLYTHAGPEIGVAATKTFTAQIAAVSLVGLALAQTRGTKYGDEISREYAALAAMPELMALLRDIEAAGVSVSHEIGDIASADVVYVLRMQRERMEAGANYVPSLREYTARWGVTPERLRPGQKVMHPGPMNRGVEIASEIADGPQSVIQEQVEMGVAVRMAVLEALSRNLPNA